MLGRFLLQIGQSVVGLHLAIYTNFGASGTAGFFVLRESVPSGYILCMVLLARAQNLASHPDEARHVAPRCDVTRRQVFTGGTRNEKGERKVGTADV